MKLIAILVSSASALRLPVAPAATAAAAVTMSSPAACWAYENGQKLAPGTEVGDVVMSASNLGSVALGFAATTVIVGAFFDFALKYGAEEDVCIISGATDKEVCGRVIDHGETGCVLSDTEGWVCA